MEITLQPEVKLNLENGEEREGMASCGVAFIGYMADELIIGHGSRYLALLPDDVEFFAEWLSRNEVLRRDKMEEWSNVIIQRPVVDRDMVIRHIQRRMEAHNITSSELHPAMAR